MHCKKHIKAETHSEIRPEELFKRYFQILNKKTHMFILISFKVRSLNVPYQYLSFSFKKIPQFFYLLTYREIGDSC